MKTKCQRKPRLPRHPLQQPQLRLLIAIAALFGATPCFALDARFGGRLGFGMTTVTRNHLVRADSPAAFGFYIEMPLNPRFTLSGDYSRSLSDSMTSSVSLTGATAKYYFLVPLPPKAPNQNDALRGSVVQKNITPYIGASMGYAESQFIAKTVVSTGFKLPAVNATALYVSGHLGAEYPIWGNTGLTGDLNYGRGLVGSADFEWLHVTFGLYLYF